MRKFILGAAAVLLLFTGCGQEKAEPDPVETEGPKMVASEPADGAEDAPYGDMTVKMTFDRSVMCPTKQQNRITIDNEASIVSVNAVSKEITIELAGLVPECRYTLSFPEGTVVGYKDNPAEPFSISFMTRPVPEVTEQDIDMTLVTENPIPNAVRLYEYMLSIYGTRSLSGAIAKVNWNLDEINWISEWTGKEPAMATFDYIHLPFSPANWINYGDITPARTWFEKGGIVSACWHWNVPVVEGGTECTCTPGDGNRNSSGTWTTTFKPSNIFVDGTWENKVADSDLEKISGYLKLLQDAGIPVVWRPLHEAAGNTYTQWKTGAWFWWGRDGGEVYVRLWRYMFDYFKKAGLRNLIWVWTAQATSDSDSDMDFYPGDDYVDIVGKDIYNTQDINSIKSQYDYVSSMIPNKMTTLSELGGLAPMTSQWSAGAKWLYFMPWYDYDNDYSENYNHSHASISWWRDAFECEAVLDISELPDDLYE